MNTESKRGHDGMYQKCYDTHSSKFNTAYCLSCPYTGRYLQTPSPIHTHVHVDKECVNHRYLFMSYQRQNPENTSLYSLYT